MKYFGILAMMVAPVAAFADIQPLDGVWSGQGQFVGETGCPAQITQAMLEDSGSYSGNNTTFPKPFDPVPLVNSDLAWSKIAENTWRGVFTQTQPTQMGDISASTVFDVTVLSETEISQDARVQVELPAQIAQLIGMAGTSCSIRTIVMHKHGG